MDLARSETFFTKSQSMLATHCNAARCSIAAQKSIFDLIPRRHNLVDFSWIGSYTFRRYAPLIPVRIKSNRGLANGKNPFADQAKSLARQRGSGTECGMDLPRERP